MEPSRSTSSRVRGSNLSARFAAVKAAPSKRSIESWTEIRRRQRTQKRAGGIAQAAVARDYARRPALLAKYGERGRARYLEDTRYHQSYLADAISFGRPSIFKDYLRWVSAVLAARGVAPEELVENLKCMREVLS